MSRVAGAPRWMWVVSIALVLSLAGALSIVRATNSQLDSITRIEGVSGVLSPAGQVVENVLVVGSDSRAGFDPADDDFSNVGSVDSTPGMRSDTLIVVRIDRATGEVAMMSVPRDLWVKIGDSEKFAKINAAYGEGPDVLVRTIQRSLNIPIHRYIEIDFAGFRSMVDAVEGVTLCVPRASRDKATGFFIGRKGCKHLDGSQALAYARSRYFEQRIDGKWVMDRTGDTGRSERQREFITVLAKRMATYVVRNPLKVNNVMTATTGSMGVDPGFDVLDMAKKLRSLGDGGARSYALPVSSEMLNENFIFRLSREASPLLAHFAGLGPAPDSESAD